MTKFDSLFDDSAPLILKQEHQRETPPVEGGRWPVSVALYPDGELAEALETTMLEALEFAGPGHWQTGRRGSAHLTVRALEYYRDDVPPGDPFVARCHQALRAAAVGPTSFEVFGLTLTAGTLMACARPTDDRADLLMDQLAVELGDDGWLEAPYGRRDIWYLNLIHFAADLAEPELLVEWVAKRRTHHLGSVTIPTASLVRFRYDESAGYPFMRPETLATA